MCTSLGYEFTLCERVSRKNARGHTVLTQPSEPGHWL